ncbi:hypothetical protein F1559_003351 [Cyanidiococcus yangmingshanensis]|uniref:Uncharacterized protein n=1 Tax=Cyanidiococcus yangmingshanensis TaxID=2690220 RepID=A0A7J7IFM3_9RHOD|nr:hypothetical protein F1559_003351 [Cyanidiococcus yangmingshanensis]
MRSRRPRHGSLTAEQQTREATEMGLPAKNAGQTREYGTESLTPETVQEAIQQALRTAEETFRTKVQAMEDELRSRDEHIQHLEDELNRIRDSKDDEIHALQEELEAALRDRENEIESAQAVLEKERRSETERMRALEIQLTEANRRVEQLDSETKRFQKLLAESEERRISLQQALEQATASPLETAAHEEIRTQLAALQQGRSVLESELDAARAEQARLVACLTASEATCRNIEQRCRDLEAAAVESTSDASLRMRRLVDAHEQERKHWQLTEQRLRRSEEEQREQLDEARKAMEKIKEELAEERRNHARLELEQAQTQSRADRFQMRLDASQSEIDALQAASRLGGARAPTMAGRAGSLSARARRTRRKAALSHYPCHCAGASHAAEIGHTSIFFAR